MSFARTKVRAVEVGRKIVRVVIQVEENIATQRFLRK